MAVVVAAVFAVATVLLAVVAVGLKADKDDLEGGGAQAEVVAAASSFVQALIDRDADVESLRDDVLPLVGGEFRDQFLDGIDRIQTFSENVGLVSTRATVGDVFTTLTDGPLVQAIVVYDATSTFADGRRVVNQDQYFVLELIRDDGRWLVSNASDLLRVVTGGVTPADGTATTTTPPG